MDEGTEHDIRATPGVVWALHPCVRGVGMVRARGGQLRPTIVRWVEDRPWWALGWEMFRRYPPPFVRTIR